NKKNVHFFQDMTLFTTHYSLLTIYHFVIMQENLIPANINIADRIYRVQMSPEDEQVVRQSVRIINDKIVEFKTKIPGKDMQDYISMVLVWFVTESKNKNVSIADENHLMGKLEQLESLIDSELQ
ncbi:cell division protein ZapA, partial [Niabella yanshanensis]